MAQQLIPGTTIAITGKSGMFEMFIPLIKATNGLTLSQVCAITGLEQSTIQNWVKRGFVANPVNKKYYERQLARILLISALRDAMKIDSIGELMALVNGSANDESDDIISDESMYDYFCKIIAGFESDIPTTEQIRTLVEATIADYVEPQQHAAERLKDALCVMTLAYYAAFFKAKAEQVFDSMRSNAQAQK